MTVYNQSMDEPQNILPKTAGRQIARAAGTVMVAFVFSQLIGLVRGMLVFRAFGTSLELDSFNAANRVSEALFNLMAGGALGSAFIPTFTGLLAKENRQRAWQLASSIANLLIIFLALVSLLAAIFAPQIVRYGLYILSPGESIGQEELTILLLRILLPTTLIFGISGLVMGILNAHQVFWVPAIAPAMYSLGMIVGVLFFPESWGITRLAWGALLGSWLHLLVQLPDLLRLHGKYTLTLGLKIAEVREVARLMGPRIFGVAIVQMNFIVNTIIALSLPVGSVSAITLAWTLMLMPQAAIAQSIAIAAMPTFSAQVAMGKFDEMRASFASALRGILLLAVPAAMGLILLRQPLIELLYQRGEFTEHSTALVAWALLFYALGLVGHSLVEIVSRAFYALHDTRTPVTVGVVAMAINIGLSLLLTKLFSAIGWAPHGGLALANSLATTLEMGALLILMRRRLKGIEGQRILNAFMMAICGTAAMSAAVLLWLKVTALLPLWVSVLGAIAAGCLIYALVLAVFRVEELTMLWNMVKSRLRRSQG